MQLKSLKTFTECPCLRFSALPHIGPSPPSPGPRALLPLGPTLQS